MEEVEYKIVPRNGHYEVYIGDEFQCSADTMIEAVDELEKILIKARNGE